jgi:hypothetical protein
VQLDTYTAFAVDDLGEVVMKRMLAGWRLAATAAPVSRSARPSTRRPA